MTQEDKDTYDQKMSDNLSASKSYADGLNATTNQVITVMQTDLTNLKMLVDTYSADNIIYDAEMRQLTDSLNTLDLGKTNLNNRYDAIYGHVYLIDVPPSTPKANLGSAMSDFNTKYTSLVNLINADIADTRVETTELSAIDSSFDTCNLSLTNLSNKFQDAITSIADKQASVAQTGTPITGLIGSLGDTLEHHASAIIQNSQSITLKVDSNTYDNAKTQENWYNFVKANNPNMIGDIESIAPPAPYAWVLATLPDGSQGRVLDKKYNAGDPIDLTTWTLPEIKVDPKKPYLLECWFNPLDVNSSYYFGREEFTGVTDVSGNLALGTANDPNDIAYLVENVVATTDTMGKWVKHYAVIPPYDAGSLNSHVTIQSSYTPDYDYKFWNADTAFIQPKIFLTYGVTDTTRGSEMYAWGMGLYEIGSKINLYGQVENLNKNMTLAQSSIEQNASDISLRVTQTTYDSDMNGLNNRLNGLEASVPYQIYISSTLGNILYQGDNQTTLQATVLKSNSDITSTIAAANFTWTRVSSDPTSDASWNSLHGVGVKSINITQNDLLYRAMFQCTVSIPTT